MRSLGVFSAALAFVVGFAFLTIDAIAKEGLNVAAVIALIVIAILAVGLVGALRHPPRR